MAKRTLKTIYSIIIGILVLAVLISQVLSYYFNIPSINIVRLIFSSTNTNSICTANVPTRASYSTVFYSQGAVFCIPSNKAVVQNFSISGYSNVAGVNGSYTASTDTELYILNSVQYGEFLKSENNVTDYTWYSGNNQGTTINATLLNSQDTYYLVFYTTSSALDTINIARSIQISYKYV